MELTRKVIRVGNSSGVILPREWYGGEARVELVRKPLNVEEDVLNILIPYLPDIIGIYLVGSYARKEQTSISDVDVLAVSNQTEKKINSGKYNIIIIPKEKLNGIIKKRVFPIYPMILEAEPIMNSALLDELRKEKLNKLSLNQYLNITKSALKIIEGLIENEKEVSGGIVYTLILRLRGIYLAGCLLEHKKYTNRDFLKILKNEGVDAKKVYEIYAKEKNDEIGHKISYSEAKKLLDLGYKLLKKQNVAQRKNQKVN